MNAPFPFEPELAIAADHTIAAKLQRKRAGKWTAGLHAALSQLKQARALASENSGSAENLE